MNLTIRIISLFTFCIQSSLLTAQQEPVSTLFWNNLIQTNPATTGAIYKHSANVLWRDYWTKKISTDIPYQTTFWANYSCKIDKINSGLGVSYRYDSWGFQKRNTALLSYAYHIPIKSLFLSIGASAGINTLSLDYSSIGSPVLNPNYSPVFTSDFGITLRHEKWNIGLSVTQLNNPTFRSGNPSQNYGLTSHFWFFADYSFDLGEKWNLTPRVQLVTYNITLLTNLQVLASWKKNLWFGVGMKNAFTINSFTVSPMIGYDIKGKFRIGYAGNISNAPDPYMLNQMTHEIVLALWMR